MGQAQSDQNGQECEGESPEDVPGNVNDLRAQPKYCESKRAKQTKGNKQEERPGGKNQIVKSAGGKAKYKRNLLSIAGGSSNNNNNNNGKGANNKKMTLEHEHVRKLSNVSNRNIQLLSMKPRSELDNYADGLRSRRRSSLINLILGAPSRGPRFSDDLCSLSSHMSDLCNFGIDYFPDTHHYPVNRAASSIAGSSLCSRADYNLGNITLRPSSLAITSRAIEYDRRDLFDAAGNFSDDQRGAIAKESSLCDKHFQQCHRRRSSVGSFTTFEKVSTNTTANINNVDVVRRTITKVAPEARGNPFKGTDDIGHDESTVDDKLSVIEHETNNHQDTSKRNENDSQQEQQLDSGGVGQQQQQQQPKARPSLASIDLGSPTSDKIEGDAQRSGNNAIWANGRRAPPLVRSKQTILAESSDSGCSQESLKISTTTKAGDDNNCTCSIEGASYISVGNAQVAAAGAPVKGRINHNARRIIHRSGSELSLYSSASVSLSHTQLYYHHQQQLANAQRNSRGSFASVMLEASCGGVCTKNPFSARRRLSSTSASSSSLSRQGASNDRQSSQIRETKLIIMFQVCLPFILAGFGNMAAGLVLNKMAHWDAFRHVPIFFVLLPSFVGLKGNIEMTLASRLSTLSNLNLLDTTPQRRHAFATNLVLILSQAIGLSIFAAFASVMCEIFMGKLEMDPMSVVMLSALVVLPCALITSMFLVTVSSVVMWLAIWLAKCIQVNPDNLSTLIAALYGDVTCVLTYGLFAQLMYSLHERDSFVWPIAIIVVALIGWPIFWYTAYKSKETHELSVSSIPPMLAAIMVSLGSGAVLSLVVGRFSRIALYQPVVNGFGANLIAVQASRVSTWLWCNALQKFSPTATTAAAAAPLASIKATKEFEFEPSDKAPYGSLASFATGLPQTRISSSTINGELTEAEQTKQTVATRLRNGLASTVKLVKLLLWSYCNSSPNSVAARLLLAMLVPAHSLYFVVIWLLAPSGYLVLTWSFYFAYIALCLTQVFILLLICEPLMTLLMSHQLDPDIFGISLLMALADLIGTLCLTGAFMLLAGVNDPNAYIQTTVLR